VTHISFHEKEELLSDQLNRRASQGSFDEDLIFGTDSDDSFAKDFTIPKLTRRKERILKRDQIVFEKEKQKREQDRLYKIELQKIQKEQERKAQEEAENKAAEDARLRQLAEDQEKGRTYRDDKRLDQMRKALEPKAFLV